MTPQVGDKVAVCGLITLMRKGKWRRTMIGEATGTIMQLKHNDMYVLSVPDHGDCLVHKTAITMLQRELVLRKLTPEECEKNRVQLPESPQVL